MFSLLSPNTLTIARLSDLEDRTAGHNQEAAMLMDLNSVANPITIQIAIVPNLQFRQDTRLSGLRKIKIGHNCNRYTE